MKSLIEQISNQATKATKNTKKSKNAVIPVTGNIFAEADLRVGPLKIVVSRTN